MKERRAVEQAKPSSGTFFILSGQKGEAVQWSPGAASASVSVITGASGETLPSDSFRRRVDEIRTWVADHMGQFKKEYLTHINYYIRIINE